MNKIRLGFAMCGSFCTFERVLPQMERAVELGYEVQPVLSEFSYSTDTRFGKAGDFVRRIEEICGRPVIHTIYEAEPIGPKKLLDILLVAPCTGNTLGKLANGITDTSVTMAVKAHLRNQRPVVIAVSTNDALGAAGKNIGMLLNQKNIYFVPMRQDDPVQKPQSIVADFTQIPQAVECAFKGVQMQPVIS
ncbi:MAG: dipicolinate synthase subunit B [Provencibacterium sp.]|jgi:dipicolinate synthase subunit B|nr:dipicolinate synthase subunit B [Provencibacterium sp.]